MKKRCVICNQWYVFVDRGTNKGTCRSNSCRAKRYYRDNEKAQKDRYRNNYFSLKKNNYSKLRAANNKAKWKERYGVDRNELLEKFNRQCANCGDKARRLIIHHIDNRGRKVEGTSKPNNHPNNLVVVCHKCHLGHHYRGYKLQIRTPN